MAVRKMTIIFVCIRLVQLRVSEGAVEDAEAVHSN